MDSVLSQSSRRIGIIINYIGLLLLLALHYSGKQIGWNHMFTAGIAVMLALSLITFFMIHMKTGLWKLVHTKSENLDERQMQVTREALEFSYKVLAITTVSIIYYMAIFSGGGVDMVTVVSLLYLAHTLPSSVIGWKQKEV
ncbi:hypothetical protein CEE37_13225 [candidate division LCP-89 bacterium B3_LCP]|uniref:DUF2178 domain-containing protein n=1 Tax=candidate division LCP-89 bacterium B3_LCP TaxID=2012998 RepID=A0A532USK7_UNCL8|nr:MAG: hypothetical protein CEE37_13225 [candidate division LCP-89 bacterium B3_LCP]